MWVHCCRPRHVSRHVYGALALPGSSWLTPRVSTPMRLLQVLGLSSRHMQRLVHDVVDMVKMREGTLQILPEPVSECAGSPASHKWPGATQT